jgi:uncharacterized membrane protein YdcZ (DUF606 family)
VTVFGVVAAVLALFAAPGVSSWVSEVPLWVWQGVGGLIGILLIFGVLVFIVQRVVLLTRQQDSDETPPTT